MPRKKKKQREKVPDLLWRRFGDRARTLAVTIASLIPRPRPRLLTPSSCLCKGRSCLLCCADASSFLRRPGDPGSYLNLLDKTFVVVNDGAPPNSRFNPVNRWPLKQVIGNTALIMLLEEPRSLNVLCSRYIHSNDISSTALKILITTTWERLLDRVGDELMNYLLKYTSIFLPLPSGNHHQVTGPPISNFCHPMFTKREPKLQEQHPSAVQCEPRRKRKRGSPDGSTGATAAAAAVQNSDVDLQHSSVQNGMRHGKRRRAFRWMRLAERKRRKLNSPMGSDKTPYTTTPPVGSKPSGKPQFNSNCKSDFVEMQCCCQLILRTPQLVSHVHQIDRKPMFYNSECYPSVLPKKHCLLKPNFSDKCLAEQIFGIPQERQLTSCIHGKDCCIFESTCLYHSLVKLLEELIRRKKWCQYRKLLDKHCDSGHEPTKPCQRRQVLSFIWDVCRAIVPSELLGSPSNRRILRRNIDRFLRMRRYEKFSLRQCMHELKTSAFPFLHTCGWNVTSLEKGNGASDCIHDVKLKLFANWIIWLFSSLVVPLVQAHFYVTETEDGKQDICYYRKSAWKKLIDRVVTDVKGKTYQQLDEADVREVIRNKKRSFGFSKVRLRPKKDKARVLANLKAPSKMPVHGAFSNVRPRTNANEPRSRTNANRPHNNAIVLETFKSVNSVLRDAHAVLKGVQLKRPEKLGSSVFDLNDIHRKICSFVIDLKRDSTTLPFLYMVVSDVSNAYDSIIQDKLLSVMKDVTKEDVGYCLRKSIQVVCSAKVVWNHENLMLIDQNTGSGTASSMPSVRFGPMHSVIVDQGLSRFVTKEDLFFKLTEHVKRNIVRLDGNFYQQTRGIPHGSVLSSLLCSLYFGHMENNVIIPFLERGCKYINEDLSKRDNCSDASATKNSQEDKLISPPKYFLLRFVDDFLFISTSKVLASEFFLRLGRGFQDYNCYMNEHKHFRCFDIQNHPHLTSSEKVYVDEDGFSYLLWNGLFINSSTFEVRCDYTRYLVNHLRSTLTVIWHGKPYYHLQRKLCTYLNVKWHPIFSDSNINSAAVVRLNIFQAFLLSAMKFHCYVSELSQFHNLQPIRYLRIIQSSLRRMSLLVEKSVGAFSGDSEFPPILTVPAEEVKWLGLTAFIQVLKKKQSRYKDLMAMLSSKHSKLSVTVNVSSPELKFAIKKSHSSVLWKIKY